MNTTKPKPEPKPETIQVKLSPESVTKLREASLRHPLRPKFGPLVNAIIEAWDGTIPN